MLAVFPAAEVHRLVDLGVLRTAIREAHRAHAAGDVPAPDRIDSGRPGEEYHVKTGQTRAVYAVKANSGFFANPPERPAIQGAILAFDTADGTPRAVVHSASITRLRTAAASCVAIEALRPHAQRFAIIGAGAQAEGHAQAVQHLRPGAEIRTFGRDAWGPNATAEARDWVRSCPVVITCTPSRAPLLDLEDVAPDALVVAVGADGPGKQELSERLVAHSVVVGDVIAQIADVGEAQHCIASGTVTREDLLELGAVLLGTVPAPDPDALTVYDSTGTGFQDAAAAEALLAVADRLPGHLCLDW